MRDSADWSKFIPPKQIPGYSFFRCRNPLSPTLLFLSEGQQPLFPLSITRSLESVSQRTSPSYRSRRLITVIWSHTCQFVISFIAPLSPSITLLSSTPGSKHLFHLGNGWRYITQILHADWSYGILNKKNEKLVKWGWGRVCFSVYIKSLHVIVIIINNNKAYRRRKRCKSISSTKRERNFQGTNVAGSFATESEYSTERKFYGNKFQGVNGPGNENSTPRSTFYILVSNEPLFTFRSQYRFDKIDSASVSNVLIFVHICGFDNSRRNWIIVSVSICWYANGKLDTRRRRRSHRKMEWTRALGRRSPCSRNAVRSCDRAVVRSVFRETPVD